MEMEYKTKLQQMFNTYYDYKNARTTECKQKQCEKFCKCLFEDNCSKLENILSYATDKELYTINWILQNDDFIRTHLLNSLRNNSSFHNQLLQAVNTIKKK